jgi:hypothetical protein
MSPHLSDDQLLDRLYGIVADSHLQDCVQCAERFRELECRRSELVEPGAVSSEFLAAQRRKIYSRLDEAPRLGLRWVPALAAGFVVAIGLLVYRPPSTTPVPASKADTGDAQLFSEVYSMEQSTEPRGAAPIHALFEDNQ